MELLDHSLLLPGGWPHVPIYKFLDFAFKLLRQAIGDLFRDCFNYSNFDHFENAIYWNDAFHWLETENRQLRYYKLNIEDHEHQIITTTQIPQGLHWGMNFLESYSYMDPMLILIQIPYMLHLEGKLLESRGCLLLVCRDDTDDFMTPLPEE
ncbi:hypothetical protein Tco_0323627 [Tanacetum coccineum]